MPVSLSRPSSSGISLFNLQKNHRCSWGWVIVMNERDRIRVCKKPLFFSNNFKGLWSKRLLLSYKEFWSMKYKITLMCSTCVRDFLLCKQSIHTSFYCKTFCVIDIINSKPRPRNTYYKKNAFEENTVLILFTYRIEIDTR